MRRCMLRACVGGLALAWAAGVAALGANVIVNGDAEAGAGSADGFAPVTIPGWTAVGPFIAVQYAAGAGFPGASDPGPPSRGLNFFAGGDGSDVTTATQVDDVSADAAAIDTGTVTFALSGYLGGFADQRDNAMLTVNFRNAGSTILSTASIGPVSNTDRGNATALLLRSTTGTVPAGTRTVEVVLALTRLDGSYDDGYADNLSLVLARGGPVAGVPIPATSWPAVAALACMLGWLARRGIVARRRA